MRKTIIIVAILLCASIVVFWGYQKHQIMTLDKVATSAMEATSQGSHCNGTVGCSCPGFAPITDGDVWQQSYCKRCGHHRSNHR